MEMMKLAAYSKVGRLCFSKNFRWNLIKIWEKITFFQPVSDIWPFQDSELEPYKNLRKDYFFSACFRYMTFSRQWINLFLLLFILRLYLTKSCIPKDTSSWRNVHVYKYHSVYKTKVSSSKSSVVQLKLSTI